MFRDDSKATFEFAEPPHARTDLALDPLASVDDPRAREHRHREIDRALRQIAARRCGLDVEEARWLRAAEDEGAWNKLGYVHGLEYLEDVFGYRPRTAKERLRVARELGQLPALEAALGAGELSYSVVRELSRVATPANVGRWIERARGRNLRDVEQMVSGRKKGDDPDDTPDPSLVDHDVLLELDAVAFALWRDLRKGLEDELGRSLDDKELVAEVHARAFSAAVPAASSTNASCSDVANANASDGADVANENAAADALSGEHARYAYAQAPRRFIQVSTCPDCRRAWQDGAGLRVQIRAQDLEHAQCDALVCDNDRETRATSAIPERIRRKVFERDGYKCTFPGCRSSRNLEAHHLKHRAHGGDHDPPNLTTLCGGHHRLDHDGLISIAGQAPDALIFIRDGNPVGTTVDAHAEPAAQPQTVAAISPSPSASAPSASAAPERDLTPPARPMSPSKFAQVELRTLAKAALTQAGYRATIAKQAVEAAWARVPANVDLTALIKEALRHCG